MMKMISLTFLLVALSVNLGDSAKPAQSCRGRCAEPVVSGQLCYCDPQCVHLNTCCPDYSLQCDAGVSAQKGPEKVAAKGNHKTLKSRRRSSNSDSDERVIINRYPRYPCIPGTNCVAVAPTRHVTTHVQTHVGVPPFYSPYARDYHMFFSHPGVPVARPNLGFFYPHASFLRPGPYYAFHDYPSAYGLPLLPYRSYMNDLCSDFPISGVTALKNGTLAVFKGDSFWTVDPVSHYISRPYSITQTLGVPSFIDTVFTRSNCQGSVYMFKGGLYWRLDRNLVLEPGFPKPLSYEFPGLTPGLTAALSVPATLTRGEMVYFFRGGEVMQRFTFPLSNIPACSVAPILITKTRQARQTEALLSEEIQIKTAMKGFPVPVTSALTAPIPMKMDQYEHYVFSGPLFYSVSVTGDLPALVGPDHPAAVVLSSPVTVEMTVPVLNSPVTAEMTVPVLNSPVTAEMTVPVLNSPVTAEMTVAEAVPVISDPLPPASSFKTWLQCPA